MLSSQIGYWFLHFSIKDAVTWHFILISDWIRKNVPREFDSPLIILIKFSPRASSPPKAYRSSNKGKWLFCVPFEASKTKFTVFWLNHELYNLITSAWKWNSSLNKHERTGIKTTAKSWSNSFLKACIVLNKLNKSILHRESIELQTNWAIINWVIMYFVNESIIDRKPHK